MEKFKTDLSKISNIVNPDLSAVPVKGNEHRMIRVAFDLFRLKNNDPEELWQVQSSDDGEFLVRTYVLPEDEKITTSDWTVIEDGKKANLTISYKGIPIKRIVTAEYDGVKTEEDVLTLQKALFRKLASDDFVIKMFNSLSENKQEMLKEAGILQNLKIDEQNLLLESLELKLQKRAEGEEDAMSDKDFEETWWENGMETDGSGSEGSEADKAYLLGAAEDILDNPSIDEIIKNKIKSLVNKVKKEKKYNTKIWDKLETILLNIEEEEESAQKDIQELESILTETKIEQNAAISPTESDFDITGIESEEGQTVQNREQIEQGIKNMSDEEFQKLITSIEKLNVV